MATKYVARHNGIIVGKRTTRDRTYTHAIVLTGGHGRTNVGVATWCGRYDLAMNEQRKWTRYGYVAEIVPAELEAVVRAEMKAAANA